MAFRFKFEHLLRLALHNESEVKTRLALKDGQIAQVDQTLAKNKEDYEMAMDEKAADLIAGRMEKTRMYFAYFIRLEKAKEYFLEERGRLVTQREKIVQELAEKRRVRKVYEKLKERHETRFQKAELKRDQKLMDEFASRAGRHDEEVPEPDA